IRQQTDGFFELFPGEEGRFPFAERERFLERARESYRALAGGLRSLEVALASLSEKPEEIFNLIRRAGALRQELEFLLESTEKAYAFWYERRKRGGLLQLTPVE